MGSPDPPVIPLIVGVYLDPVFTGMTGGSKEMGRARTSRGCKAPSRGEVSHTLIAKLDSKAFATNSSDTLDKGLAIRLHPTS